MREELRRADPELAKVFAEAEKEVNEENDRLDSIQEEESVSDDKMEDASEEATKENGNTGKS